MVGKREHQVVLALLIINVQNDCHVFALLMIFLHTICPYRAPCCSLWGQHPVPYIWRIARWLNWSLGKSVVSAAFAADDWCKFSPVSAGTGQSETSWNMTKNVALSHMSSQGFFLCALRLSKYLSRCSYNCFFHMHAYSRVAMMLRHATDG